MEDRVHRLARREGVLTALRYVLDIELRFFAAMAPVPAALQRFFHRLVEYAVAVTVVRKAGSRVGASPTSAMTTADLEGELRRRIATACDARE